MEKAIEIKSVIYKITNIINDKKYIGSSVNYKARKQEHFRDLFLNKHHSIALQRAYNLYGCDNFIFEIIERVQYKNNLIKREQYFIDLFQPEYNCCKVAGSPLGRKMTKEQIIANSLRNKGDNNSNCKIKESEFKNISKLRESETIKDIAQKYGVHSATITRILKKDKSEEKIFLKIYDANSRKILSDSAKTKTNSAKILIDFNTGVFYNSLKELSDLLKINYSTLSDRIKGEYNPLKQYVYV